MLPHTETPIVEATGLLFEYPGVRALDHVSVSIARGSVTALVGPNGAGKTTLLRCLAGLDRPMLGAIRVAGVDVLEAPRESHRKMGYLSDFFGLYDALTVRQVLHYAAAAQGVPEASIAGLVARTAEQLGIADKLGVKSAALSRGQRQRVAIGQAMVHQPQVLILDEPASGLDPEARHDLAQLFLALQASGMTLLVSSHILAELDEYSSHMLVMRKGRIIENRSLAGVVGQSMQVRIAFDAPSDLPAVRAIFEQLSIVENNPDNLLVEIVESPGAASALLKQLVDAGLQVASFAPERQNLAASYLRTVQSPPVKDGSAVGEAS